MAGIWKDISIKWKGVDYVITPTLTFINHLEQRPGNSLTNLVVAAGNEKLGTVRCAEIIYDALKFKSAPVENVEEVWEAFGGISAGLTNAAAAILFACLPQPKEEESAPVEKKPRRKTVQK